MNQICRAIIVAAGRGQRMGGDIPKQFLKLEGKPIIVHTLFKFDCIERITDIIVVIADEYMEYMEGHVLDRYRFKKPVKLVSGAASRQQSVFNGIKALPQDTDIVIIHDGVRPFVERRFIEESIDRANIYGGAVVGVPVKDTIKKVDSTGTIETTLQRDVLWAVQTPQTFKFDIILKAHRQAIEDEFVGTDDSMLVERIGFGVNMIMGSYANIKITTKEDLILAKAMLGRMRG